MDIIVWIIFGALAGWIASTIAGTNAQQSTLSTIVVGIIGSVAGGYVMNVYASSHTESFNLYGMIVAVLSSIIALWIYQSVNARAS